MTAVLIYTRLSTEDVQDATVRQEAACRSYAAARNWDVAGTLSDLDASAYQPRVRRPGLETLIAEAAARSADGVLIWRLDRLVRRPKDFERLWEVAERRGVFIASVAEPVDCSSPIGLAMLRILVALAGFESATTVARDCWPAILDRETFARLQLTLNHPGRRGAPPRHHKRLATGFAQWGPCGQNGVDHP